MCGADCTAKLGVDNTGKYNMYIPDPREPSKRLCLSKCPTSWGFKKAESTPTGTYMCAGGNCDVEGKDEPEFYIQRTKGDTLSNDGMLDNCFIPGSNSTDCWFPTYPTQEALHKCVPMLPANLSESDKETLAALGMPADSESFTGALAFMTNPAGEIGKFTAELALTWPVVAASVGIALIMGFVWMLLIRWFAMIMLYITTVALFLILGVVAIFAWDKTGKIKIFDSVSAQTGQNVTALIAASGAAGDHINQPQRRCTGSRAREISHKHLFERQKGRQREADKTANARRKRVRGRERGRERMQALTQIHRYTNTSQNRQSYTCQ